MKLKTPLLQSQSMDAHVHQEFYYKNLEHNQNLRLFLNTNKEKVNKIVFYYIKNSKKEYLNHIKSFKTALTLNRILF